MERNHWQHCSSCKVVIIVLILQRQSLIPPQDWRCKMLVVGTKQDNYYDKHFSGDHKRHAEQTAVDGFRIDSQHEQ